MIDWFQEGQLPNGKPAGCAGCPLEEAGMGFVPGIGPDDAEVMMVGERPGDDEAIDQFCLTCQNWWVTDGAGMAHRDWMAAHHGHLRVGVPFVGRSGQFMTRLMGQAGLDRSRVYLTNIVKCRPPLDEEPPDDAVQYCRKYHVRELEHVRPNVVAGIGNAALEWYTGNRGIRAYRGSLERLDPARSKGCLKLVPILNPAGIMRSVGKENQRNTNLLISLTISDFRKVAAQARSRDLPPLGEQFIIEPDLFQVREFAATTGQDGYMCDIETPHDLDIYQAALLCIAFHCYRTGRTLCLPWLTPAGPYWTPDQEPEVAELMQKMFDRPCDWHNMGFDVPVIESHGWRVNLRDCTMTMDWQLNPENYHALHEVMKRHTDLPYHKDEGKGDPKLMKLPNHRFWNYNAKDGRGQGQSKPGLVRELEREVNWSIMDGREISLKEYYDTITQPLMRELVNMSKRGMWIDEGVRLPYLEEVKAKQVVMQQTLDEQLGTYLFNPRSSNDLKAALIDRLGLPVLKYTEKGNPSFDEDTLLRYKLMGPPDTMDAILEFRGLLNLESTFLTPRIYPDGRVRVQWSQHRTVSARLASSPNLQNIIMTDGGRARSMYASEPGNSLIHSDHSQVELRWFSWLAPDEEWKAMFREYDRRTTKVGMWKATGQLDSELQAAIQENLPWFDEALKCQQPEDQEKYAQIEGDHTGNLKKRVAFSLFLWTREADIHTQNASVMYSRAWRLVTYDQRFRGKIFIYGFLYGGEPEGILEHGGRGLSRATEQMQLLHEMVANIQRRHPSLDVFRSNITGKLMKTRKLVYPGGNIRYFFGDAKDIKRQGWCTMNQTAAATLINREFVRIARRIATLDPVWGLVNQVHDMALSEMPDPMADEVAKIHREEMNEPVLVDGEPVVFPAKVSKGRRWSDFS